MIVVIVRGKSKQRARRIAHRRMRNPVRELPISQAEAAQLKRQVQKQFGGRGRDLRKAAVLYTAFTGHEEVDAVKVEVAPMPAVMVEIGYCDFVGYTTVRDYKEESYKHDFKKKSRPLLCSGPDGEDLYLLGGAFTFGERGIVDD